VLISILRVALFVLLFGFSATGLAAAPLASTQAATGITSSSVVLNGVGQPNGQATTGRFRYSATDPGACNDTFGTRVPTSSGTDLGTGSTPVPYSITATGLTPGVTYYFCAIVSNTAGTAFGSVLSFTIPYKPVVLTSSPAGVTSSSATLQGAANPVAATTSAWFRYSSSNPGICNDSFGTRAPSSTSASLGSGITSVPYTQSIGGLVPGGTYYYCAIASNSYGTTFGAIVSFTTPATAPVVTTASASALTRTAGQLNGYGNPGGDATTAWFRYSTASPGTCNDTFGTRAPASGGSALGAGTSNTPFSQAVSGLIPGATYYYCAIAANALGTSWGAVQTFITPSAPSATTTAVTYLTNTSATLNGSGNPNRTSATGWFRYAATNPGTCDDKFGSRAPVSGGSSLGNDIYDQPYSQSISGLSPATTYFYCAIVSSSEGTAFGSILSFTTATVPAVNTAAASGITPTGATLNGSGIPNGASASGWFRYSNTNPGSCSDSFGNRAPSSSSSSLGAGSTLIPFGQSITGLVPGVTYYYCAIVGNSYGTGFGAVLSFTTPAMAPTVTTGSATSLTRTTGVLSGYANPGGDATTAWFRFSTSSPGSCNDSFGTRAPAAGGSAVSAGSGNTYFSQPISGLTPATTYYYCALAANSIGTTIGAVQSFITPSSPTATTAGVTYLTTSSATINGTGNPNRATAAGWFRYSTTNPVTCDDKFGSRSPLSGGTSLGNDIYDQPFSQGLSGLSGGTTYYYCAIVASSEGTAFGIVQSFTTSGIPTATSSAASGVNSTGATLKGEGVPNGASASGWFRYSNTNPGSCNDSFGSRAPSSSSVSLGAGTTSVPFGQSISGLQPGTTYYFCAIVSNTYGTGFGSVLSFATPAMAPTVTTGSASGLTRTSGTLGGYANPGGDATTAWFRFGTASPGTCNDSFGTRAPATGGSALGSGSSNTSFSQPIGGLSPATTYYYCALAANSMGTAMGAVQTFVTPSSPKAFTASATYVTDTAATLNGAGNPSRASATGWFRYSSTNPGACDDKFGSRAPVTSGVALGNDIYDQPYSQTISGLSPATTYYYCAIIASTEGMAFGAVMSFTTSTVATVTTNAATGISATSATLNGAGNPNGASASGWFRYSNTNPGTCSDSFGWRAPSSSSTSLGAGNTSVPYGQSISGLSPGTTYYYCAIVSNSYGTGFGAVLTFVTPAMAPTVTTGSASSLTMTTGVLSGYANPGGDATTAWFRFSTASPGTCNDSFGTRAPATGGSALGSGTSNVAFSQPISGLSPATTYYYCALATNSIGTVLGAVQTFITPSPPTATTTSTTYLTNSSATLNGSGNPNRASATGWFRYSTTNPSACDDKFGSRTPLSGGSALGNDIYDQPFSQTISGLSPATTYYYCAIVASSEGTAFGALLTFTTASTATATTTAATGVTSSSATLNGTGNPNGASASAWFRYSNTNPGTCSDSFGWRASTGNTSLGAGSTSVPMSQTVSGLLPGTTYYYCIIVSNSYGTGFGKVMSFVTPVTAPTVTTGSANSLTMTTGALNGYANPGGAPTTGWFRFSTASPGTCNDTFGTRAPATGGSALGSGTSNATFTQAISGLAPATTYYYCAIAKNSVGMAWGAVQTFITPSTPTVVTASATSITTSSATLNGSGNPSRASAAGWFRYATTNPGACDDKFGSRAPTTGGISLGNDIYDQPFTQGIVGLSPATTYYYCAIVASSEGTAFGSLMTFTTSAPATATTTAVVSVSATTATLTGTGNPNGAAATGWFRYSTTSPGTCNDSFGIRTPSSSGISLGAGTTSTAFGQPITGLSPGVTYYYCAIVSNAYGAGFGAVMSFITPAGPPSVSTDYASGIVTNLNGSANPNGSATTGWFRLATSSPGTCNDTFGTRIPATGGTALGSGSGMIAYANPAPTLTPGTTYYYCAIASNAVGTSFGVIRSFTAPMPPTVSTLAATPVTATTATLNGTSNPNGNSTIGWFRYSTSSPGTCNDVFGTRAPVSSGTSLGSGTSPTPFAESISGLSPSTTYYFCAMALSAYGTALGSVLSFTTPPATLTRSSPAGGSGGLVAKTSRITTLAATEIIGESAILHGSATPSGVEMPGWFRYSTTAPMSCNDFFGTRAPHKASATLGAGEKPVDYSQAVTGLAPGTTYFYCAIGTVSDSASGAGSAESTSFGEVLSLTTRPAAPAVTTNPPTDVAVSTATLNARVMPRGDATTSWFRYDTSKPENCNDSFGVRAPANVGKSLGSGTSAVSHTEPIFGLSRGETYYYCAIAANSLGTTYGEMLSFIPGATAPDVTTESPISVDTSSGTVGATVYANGSAVTVWFRVGESDPGVCDESFGSSVTAKRRGLTQGAQALVALPDSPSVASTSYESVPLLGLRPGTIYYYCAVASNMGGLKFGQVRSFTTASPPPELGTVTSSAADPIESQQGCSFTAGKNRSSESSPLALLLLLPMLGGLMLRRRLRARAA